nr:immunoglobulin heavy chain junction region [Macaca mulatta]MOV86831.1 immunoglobulin heavy chain junction region [Macaca mulatta]MOV87349.1 immunoglobulin heavy chain junction region [Macaca mulatta]MOV87416.1 immunoglobulin heavy chain junction region [Macaca mulatta]MOV87533.1 immunoglobulin heavy chain junction region [Macaca mulatta]
CARHLLPTATAYDGGLDSW